MNIVICDDESLYSSAIYSSIERWKNASGHYDVRVLIYASSDELLESFERPQNIDLLFLDIMIPGEVNGLELARRIRANNSDIHIVFVTNYDEFVYEGYSVNALRYLRKPIWDNDIFFCCSYVYNRKSLTCINSICVRSANKRITLGHAEILYIEVRSHTLYIFTTSYDEPIKVSARISDVESKLPADLFTYSHRSYLVNISRIRLLTRTKLSLDNGVTLPVSRTYTNVLNSRFDKYFHGGKLKNGLDSV